MVRMKALQARCDAKEGMVLLYLSFFSFVAFIYCLFLWFCMPTVIMGMPPIRRKDLTTP